MTNEKLAGLEQLNELQLTEQESGAMLKIFEEMQEQEAQMGAFNTENVEVMVHVLPLTNVLREDVAIQHFSREALLEGAPEHTEDSWQVPRLVK